MTIPLPLPLPLVFYESHPTSQMNNSHSTITDVASAPEILSGSDLLNFNATNNTVFMPAHTSMRALTNLSTQPNFAYPDVPGAWPMLAQPFLDTSSVAFQPAGNSQWTGAAPHVAHSMAVKPNQVVSPNNSTTPPEFQDELAWLLEPGQSIYHASFSSSESRSGAGLVGLENGAYVAGAMTSPAEWATDDVTWPIPTARSMPMVAIGKHCCEDFYGDRRAVGIESNKMPPQKRAGGGITDGIQRIAQSVAGTHHKPVARTPARSAENAPTEVGFGAERLATTNAQGVHHQLLLGPSFQQGCAVEATDGQLIWVEGSVEEKVVYDNDSTVQQRQRREGGKDKHFKIPKKFQTGHKALLAATEADWARGAVREIKCRLCPNTKLKTWEDFRRHCDTMEAHPLKISFCDDCGDFFSRRDSLRRHRKNPPAECISVTPEKATMKRRETQKLHEQFRVRLERGLEKREDIGMAFSQIIKDLYPESSKRRTGGSRLKGH